MRLLVTRAEGPAGAHVAGYLERAADVDTVCVDAHPRLPHVIECPRLDDPAGYTEFLSGLSWEGIVAVGETEPAVLPHEWLPEWTHRRYTATICSDKLATASLAGAKGVAVPDTAGGALPGLATSPGWVVKPRYGSGSKHTLITSDRETAAHWVTAGPCEMVGQKQVFGPEWGADGLWRNGRMVAGFVYRVDARRGGLAADATVLPMSAAQRDWLDELGGVFDLHGPANIDWIELKPDVPVLLEINARWSPNIEFTRFSGGPDLLGIWLHRTFRLAPPERDASARPTPTRVLRRHYTIGVPT